MADAALGMFGTRDARMSRAACHLRKGCAHVTRICGAIQIWCRDGRLGAFAPLFSVPAFPPVGKLQPFQLQLFVTERRFRASVILAKHPRPGVAEWPSFGRRRDAVKPCFTVTFPSFLNSLGVVRATIGNDLSGVFSQRANRSPGACAQPNSIACHGQGLPFGAA